MDQVDSGVKVAVESVIQSESVVAESRKTETQQTLSQAQPDGSQGMPIYNNSLDFNLVFTIFI